MQIPLAWVVEGDYEYRCSVFGLDTTMDDIASAIGGLTVGWFVKEKPGGVLRVRSASSGELLPRTQKLGESKLKAWSAIEIVQETAASNHGI